MEGAISGEISLGAEGFPIWAASVFIWQFLQYVTWGYHAKEWLCACYSLLMVFFGTILRSVFLIYVCRDQHLQFHLVLEGRNTQLPADPIKWRRLVYDHKYSVLMWYSWYYWISPWLFALGILIIDPPFITSHNKPYKLFVMLCKQRNRDV